LGYIVEKAGGKPYQEALKDRIASKIGLKDTYLGTGNTNPARNEALASNSREQIQDRSLHLFRIRCRQRPVDDQSRRSGENLHEGKMTLLGLRRHHRGLLG
jgi:CubicO group peptidase (beta-lactamase class C family)